MSNKVRIAVLEARLTEQDDRMARELSARDRASDLASANLTIRLDHANGLIAQMKEQNADLQRKLDRFTGWTMGAGAIVALAWALVSHFWK